MKQYRIEEFISASPQKTWEALTQAEKIAQYMFGSIAESSWEKGADLKYYMEKDGNKVLVVHGRITEIEPPHILEHTLFPSTWDIEDIPENYLTVKYVITPLEKGCKLEIIQTGFETAAQGEKRYNDVAEGWKMTLPQLKKVAEQ